MRHKLVLGVDEAGYGPNLGPLVVALSGWRVPLEMTETGLSTALQRVFKAKPWARSATHVPLGDSKRIYSPSKGLGSLEIGLLAMASQLGNVVADGLGPEIALLLKQLGGRLSQSPEQLAGWYAAFAKLPVPKAAGSACAIAEGSQLAQQALSDVGIEFVFLAADIVTEASFNTDLETLGSKGLLLSRRTLRLVAQALETHSGEDAEVFCDRQGGRKNYLSVLQDAIPDRWFDETRAENHRSSYRASGKPAIEVHFTVGADSYPPTALASMMAKYLRERSMEAINAFWLSRVPGLRPTAGYPVDAKRFAADIDSAAEQLGVSKWDWWRNK